MIVVDASLAVDLVSVTPEAERLSKRLEDSEEQAIAPELLDLEVLQVLRRQLRLKALTRERAERSFGLLKVLPVLRVGHQALLPRVWDLHNNLTAYDAAYVALAEMLDAALWTRDRKYESAPHRARIVVL